MLKVHPDDDDDLADVGCVLMIAFVFALLAIGCIATAIFKVIGL